MVREAEGLPELEDPKHYWDVEYAASRGYVEERRPAYVTTYIRCETANAKPRKPNEENLDEILVSAMEYTHPAGTKTPAQVIDQARDRAARRAHSFYVVDQEARRRASGLHLRLQPAADEPKRDEFMVIK